MLMGISLKNYKSFNNEVSISFLANNKLGSRSVVQAKKYPILRSCVLYGGNNSGKTNFLSSVSIMKTIFLRDGVDKKILNLITNFLYPNRNDAFPIEIEIQYFDRGCQKEYSFGIVIHENGDIEDYLFYEDTLVYSKTNDSTSTEYDPIILNDPFHISLLHRTSKDSLYINNILRNQQNMSDQEKEVCPFFGVKRMFDSIRQAGKSNDLNDIAFQTKRQKEILENPKLAEIYNLILEKADISISKHKIVQKEKNEFSKLTNDEPLDENAQFIRNITDAVELQMSIQTEYQRYDHSSVSVPAYQFDSGGTTSFASLLVDILLAIEKNEFLMIDEIDRSLHYRLSSELINFINNLTTSDGQFLLTAHDVKLLDPAVFRKDQVYFVDRHSDEVEVFSLNDFVTNSKTTTDIRSTTKFENQYVKGNLGALPNPDFFDIAKKFVEYGDSNG